MFDLSGKCALITGGSSGIGLGMARGLAAAGADVCLWGIDATQLREARSSLAHDGSGVTTQLVDVSNEDGVVSGVREATEILGGLDIVVVNAGISSSRSRFADSTTAEYRKVMGVNLDGAYWTLREASKVLIEQDRGGSMIVTSSVAAVEGAKYGQIYAATKAGVAAMARSCAVELAPHRIRVNSVLPGWIATDMTSKMRDSEYFETHVIPRVPLSRWGTPDDFAGIAVYLASDASAFQTGTDIVIDGGYTIF